MKGDFGDGQKAFRAALDKTDLKAPNGEIKLDENRQAIGTNFVTEVVEQPDGSLANKLVAVVPNVTQTLGLDKATFAKIGLPSRDVPECKKYQ